MDKLAANIELVLKRLDAIEAKIGSGGGGGGGSGAEGEASESVQDFDALVKEHIPKLLEVSAKIGGDVATHAPMVDAAVKALRHTLLVAASSKKPSDAEFGNVLKPLSAAMQEVIKFRDANRPSKQFNHLSTFSEGIQALSWVSISPAPGPFAQQSRGGSEFYSNKILKEFRGKDETHVEFVKLFNGFLKGLEPFIKQHHRTGLAFTGTGAASALAGAAPAAAAAPKAAAPKKAAPAAASGSARNNLFGELSKGNIGAAGFGLKKVDRSQMTHKNPELRGKAPVPAVAKKTPAKRRGLPTGTPKFALEGNKWVIEFQDSNKDIVIENIEPKQTVYIYACWDTTIQIKGKANAVTIDNSKKVSVVATDIVAQLEIVNSQSVNTQITGRCPTVGIEKTSGANLYISKENKDVEIVTAKIDSVNIHVPKDDDSGEFHENPVPEQFKSVILASGKIKTGQVDHSD